MKFTRNFRAFLYVANVFSGARPVFPRWAEMRGLANEISETQRKKRRYFFM